MRTMLNRVSGLELLLIAATVAGAGACEALPPGGGQFWNGHDASLNPTGASGAGGTVDPSGTGGTTSIDPAGSAGDTGSGAGGSGDDTGLAGTSGGVAGTGGTTGMGGSIGPAGGGGVTGSAGAGARGGSGGTAGSARGGTTGSGGTTGTAGRGGTTGAAGRGGSSGTTGAGGSSGVLAGSLMISVTTKAPGGRYQPDNVGAIWIADANTRFIKSLYVWGQQRRRELTRWTSATSAAGLANNLVDAVTAATMRSHGARMASWNGTDANRALVADGPYKVCFELEDGAQQYQCVDFSKSRTAQTLMPADTTGFTARKIAYTP